MKITIPLSCAGIFLASGSAFAQSAAWISGVDVPLTNNEVLGGLTRPTISDICIWDPDGPGQLAPRPVIAGVMDLSIPGGLYAAMLDDDGWRGMTAAALSGRLYSLVTYAAPGDVFARLYAGGAGLFRFDAPTWTRLSQSDNVFGMIVADLDNAGPQPAKIVMAARSSGVFTFDGSTVTQLIGGDVLTSMNCVFVWDRDGTGPLPPRLLAGGQFHIFEWDGAAWTRIAVSNDNVYSMCSFDFDGSGPNPPQLVAAGAFTTLNSAASSRVATMSSAGVWSTVGPGSNAGVLNRCVSFDPDGAGAGAPWLVVTGTAQQLGGVPINRIGYFTQGAWHNFPVYFGNSTIALCVNEQAQYSDTPQMIATGATSRPSLGIFAQSIGLPVASTVVDCSGAIGSTVTLSTTPSGDELYFQWFKGQQALSGGVTPSGAVLSGTRSPQLKIENLQNADAGAYHVRITNAAGAGNSNAATVSIGCAADFNQDATVDFFDYLDFVLVFSQEVPAADFNADGVIDFFDYLDFVAAFSEPC